MSRDNLEVKRARFEPFQWAKSKWLNPTGPRAFAIAAVFVDVEDNRLPLIQPLERLIDDRRVMEEHIVARRISYKSETFVRNEFFDLSTRHILPFDSRNVKNQ